LPGDIQQPTLQLLEWATGCARSSVWREVLTYCRDAHCEYFCQNYAGKRRSTDVAVI
jgi:hypothetical protein